VNGLMVEEAVLNWLTRILIQGLALNWADSDETSKVEWTTMKRQASLIMG
jgi:hypothetical protein